MPISLEHVFPAPGRARGRSSGLLDAALPSLVLLGAVLALGGCATPGPLHVYSVPSGQAAAILDRSDGPPADMPSFLEPPEQLVGFAYDPFTDHFFLRLEGGTRIRVVDRPARAIKREFKIEAAATPHDADLAVRPRDGHIFLLTGSEVLETTRLGKPLRKFALAGISSRPAGIALDSARNELLVLDSAGQRVTRHDLDGAPLGELTLERPARASLAFDAEKREFYATLRDSGGQIGIFNEAGKWLRLAEVQGSFVDVGPRSLVRVF